MLRVRIVCLSNAYDQNYHDVRGEVVSRILSVGKRIDLFECLKIATGSEVIVLSSPPQAKHRRSARWLPAVQTKLASVPQLFCCNWDIPKLRVPLSWIFYAWQAMRHTRDDDIILLDNYELIYVIAAYFTRLFRRVTFILDYEDGKHLIDRSWSRVLSGIAEWLGRRLIRGAILAHPAMKERLPAGLPTLLVPGFVTGDGRQRDAERQGEIRFLYSGTLDATRGVDLLLKALEKLPESGWHLDISGAGSLAAEVEQVAISSRFAGKVCFHQTLPATAYQKLVASSQVGLNCQRASDPISEVTFPSKIFSYLSAGLMVLSSAAGAVREICGEACFYFDEETPESLSFAMDAIIRDYSAIRERLEVQEVRDRFSPEGTATRLRQFLESVAGLDELPEHR
jgi:glycosyltransferase involved in cell wall biosynthesis